LPPAIKTVKTPGPGDIPIDNVASKDRPHVTNIVDRILAWQTGAQTLSIDITDVGSHYNVLITGWSHPIEDVQWYETFLKTDGHPRRESVFDWIIDSSTTPNPGNDTGCIKIVRIRKISGGNSERAAQKKRSHRH
jgi:hypothetical protein